MAEHGIEDRDAFIAHAVKFDHDNNMYLKKVELTDAAKSFVEQSSEDSDDSEQRLLKNPRIQKRLQKAQMKKQRVQIRKIPRLSLAQFVEQRMLQTLVHVLLVRVQLIWKQDCQMKKQTFTPQRYQRF